MFFKKNKKAEDTSKEDFLDIEKLFEGGSSDEDIMDMEMDGQEIDITSSKESDKSEKEPLKFQKDKKKKNKKDKNSSDFVTMDNTDSSSFVVVGNEQNRFFSLTKSFFKVFFSILGFTILGALIFCVILYKGIPEEIKGEEQNIFGYSIISSNYQPNIDELKNGDSVICLGENQIKWFPIVYDYKVLEVKSRNGYIIYCVDSTDEESKIQSIDIAYITKEDS